MIWLLIAVMTAVAVLAVLWPLARRAQDLRSASDVAVYKDQLEEIERDQGFGLIAPAEADAARKLFDGGNVLDVSHPSAAQFRRKHHAHQPQLAEFFDCGERKFSGVVPLADVRRDLALRKFAHALLELQLFFVELEIQGILLLREGLLHHSGGKARNGRTDRLVRV